MCMCKNRLFSALCFVLIELVGSVELPNISHCWDGMLEWMLFEMSTENNCAIFIFLF